MATWGEILQEIIKGAPDHPDILDIVRRKYLKELFELTSRNVIVYATKWTEGLATDPDRISITPEDMQGFMEVVYGLQGEKLDLILHSPGGSPDATEALVSYLRSKFKDIRVLVPHAAMSAATMLACAANRIVMGRHSFLGPTDPLMIVPSDHGHVMVPAHAIQEQFTRVQAECKKDPDAVGSWLPIIRQYGPGLLTQCQLAQDLAQSLVAEWLERYMFAGEAEAKERAAGIAKSLTDHQTLKSHGRFLSRDRLRELGLTKIDDLEADQKLQDAVLAVFHATSHTFGAGDAIKIIENHNGRAFVKHHRTVNFKAEFGPPPGFKLVPEGVETPPAFPQGPLPKGLLPKGVAPKGGWKKRQPPS